MMRVLMVEVTCGGAGAAGALLGAGSSSDETAGGAEGAAGAWEAGGVYSPGLLGAWLATGAAVEAIPGAG